VKRCIKTSTLHESSQVKITLVTIGVRIGVSPKKHNLYYSIFLTSLIVSLMLFMYSSSTGESVIA
jgi:hypothetical protein